jgi:hypothetical protein
MATQIGSGTGVLSTYIPDLTDSANIQTALKQLYYGTTAGTLSQTVGIYGALYTLYSGNPTLAGNVTITGNLTVNGTTTTINSTTLNIDDINIVLGNDLTTDAAANGGGITLKGLTGSDKTFTWIDATDSWTSNQNINIVSPGTAYKIAGTNVLTATQVLGRTPAGTSAGDIATIDATQTLTNKTLTAPAYNVVTISGTATIAATTDIAFISAASTAYTITLPTPVNGRRLSIIRTDSTAFTISISGHINNVSGTTSTTFFPTGQANRRAVFVSNGTTWYTEWAGSATAA